MERRLAFTDLSSFIPDEPFLTAAQLERGLLDLHARGRSKKLALSIERLGVSREGRDLWGVEAGRGERRVSLVAGAHADEPVGPVTAFALIRALVESPELTEALEEFRFFICPQINPDGAERNRVWFEEPLDPLKYLARATREAPGEDIEFGYPRAKGAYAGADDPDLRQALESLRPENAVVADFLRSGAPFTYHASLHGIAFSEGAWFLIGGSWAERSAGLMDRMAARVEARGWAWHDVDRRGEKGFRRLRRGFSTTPNHAAMRRYFLDAGDASTAAKFHPSSMEYVQSLGGDPLVMVSELPLFLVSGAEKGGGPEVFARRQERMREALTRARMEMMRGEGGRAAAGLSLEGLGVRAVPLREHAGLQWMMIREALEFLGER